MIQRRTNLNFKQGKWKKNIDFFVMYNHEPYILFSIIYIRNAVYVRKKENNFNSFHLEATQKKKNRVVILFALQKDLTVLG